jgi:predicted lactoylglutathione lyase
MMAKMIFLNLPVRDLAAATAFYEALGGTVNPQFSDDTTKSIMLSDTIVVMAMTHERFASFTERPIGDARKEAQALIALNVDTRNEVDATVERLVAAGGKADPNPSQDHGFMYGRSAEDPDGYVWELVWMDMPN